MLNAQQVYNLFFQKRQFIKSLKKKLESHFIHHTKQIINLKLLKK